jgi:hypothetical protein
MDQVFLSTAYLAPVQYYTKLFAANQVWLEACDNYIKQTYRNRCTIAAANGPMTLSIPIVKPSTHKCLTRDIEISDHGNWRHLHWNAITSAYNSSPYFEYYIDDFAPFYERKHTFLVDFNDELRELICSLLDVSPIISKTTAYAEPFENDYRSLIHPKQIGTDPQFDPQPYYQVFKAKFGFTPNLSIIDLLFNKGPESLLVLRDSVKLID